MVTQGENPPGCPGEPGLEGAIMGPLLSPAWALIMPLCLRGSLVGPWLIWEWLAVPLSPLPGLEFEWLCS